MATQKRERLFTNKYFEPYELYLKNSGLSENTICSYLWTIKDFLIRYRKINVDNLLLYKSYLKEYSSPSTVNLRIQGINKYLKYLNMSDLCLKTVKIQQKSFLENVISNEDYRYLKRKLKSDGLLDWYYLVWFMAATGARVSETVKTKVEHVEVGYFDIYGKGGKVRRLYIPARLRNSLKKWIAAEHKESGFLFLNKNREPMTMKGIEAQLKTFANRYKIDANVMYPHSFRHRFGKNFIERYNDIAFLADIMGHESIETTRIYLRKTCQEQREIIDRCVNW